MPKKYILKSRGLFVVSLSIRSDEYPDAAKFETLNEALESARRIQKKFSYQVDVYRDYGLETEKLVLSVMPDGTEITDKQVRGSFEKEVKDRYAENNLYVE